MGNSCCGQSTVNANVITSLESHSSLDSPVTANDGAVTANGGAVTANDGEVTANDGASIRLFEAKFDFEGQQEGDLKFVAGEQLLVLASSFGQANGWCLAKRPNTQEFKFAPDNYLVGAYDGADYRQLRGYCDVTRPEAERLLFGPENQDGAFLLRTSSSNQPALSVKAWSNQSKIKFFHFIIQSEKEESQLNYFIQNGPKFQSVQHLLLYYTIPNRGLKCVLRQPITNEERPLVPFRNYLIDESQLTMGEVIGSGSFGVVHKAKLLHRIPVVVKKLKVEAGWSTEEQLRDEAKIQHRLRHKNIVSLIGYCEPPGQSALWLVMEFAEKGSLKDNLKNIASFEKHLDFLNQLAHGMLYLEQNQVVHRDLRAANVLLSAADRIKISDFGLAKLLTPSDQQSDEEPIYIRSKNFNFPVRWTAPEAMEDSLCTAKSDVWSFGVCAYEILSQGARPYRGMSNQQVISSVRQGKTLSNPCKDKFRPEQVEYWQSLFLFEKVLMPCWQLKDSDRPTFAELSLQLEELEVNADDVFQRYQATGGVSADDLDVKVFN